MSKSGTLLISAALFLTTMINAAEPAVSPARDIGDFPLMQAVWSQAAPVSANVSEFGDHLVVRYFDRRGSFGDRIEIPIDSYGNGEVSIASAGDGQVVVDYSAFTSNHLVGVGVERVFTRTIERKGERPRPVRR